MGRRADEPGDHAELVEVPAITPREVTHLEAPSARSRSPSNGDPGAFTISLMPANAGGNERMPRYQSPGTAGEGAYDRLWEARRRPCPSMIFRRACWTPSPDTSRVMEASLPCGPILSISSTVDDALSAFLMSPVGLLDEAQEPTSST